MKVLATDYRRPISAIFKDIPNFWDNWADWPEIGGNFFPTISISIKYFSQKKLVFRPNSNKS